MDIECLCELCLTDRQRQLVRLIFHRRRYDLPTVQRDLAEEMGIRRDSLNKLLARTRALLKKYGIELKMPRRSRTEVVCGVSLSAWDEI